MKETLIGSWQTIVRSLVKAGAGGLATKGIIEQSEVETVVSAVVLLFSILWGIWEKKKIAKDAAQIIHVSTATTTETK